VSARAGCRSAAAVRRAAATAPALLLAFDVLVLDGRDLRPLSWQDRHAHLTQLGLAATLTPGAPGLTYLQAHDDGPALIRATHDLGLEGVVAKHRHSPTSDDARTGGSR
jgi:ATP-dependent DNA ligase